MASTLTGTNQILTRGDHERQIAANFVRTATIRIARHHILSLRKIAKSVPIEKSFWKHLYKPDNMNVAIVRWLLAEGSNLEELYKQAGGELLSRYSLDRRALATIAELYPMLDNEVRYLIYSDYSPMKWPPICLREGYSPLALDETALSKLDREEQILNHILLTQTDYDHIMRTQVLIWKKKIARAEEKVTEEMVEQRKRLIEASCYLAIADTFPEIAALAREKADKLNKSNPQEAITQLNQ